MELISIYAGSIISAAVAGFLAGRAARTSGPSPAQKTACRALVNNPYSYIPANTGRALVRRGFATSDRPVIGPAVYTLTTSGRKLAR